MILNAPMFDYLRLTTFDKQQFEAMSQFTHSLFDRENPQDFGVMQYKGVRFPHAFLGEGIQGSSKHWLCQWSGQVSNGVAYGLRQMRVDAKCTRIDPQVTIMKPDSYSARAHADILEAATWPNRHRKVRLIQNFDEFDSVYIGSDHSRKRIIMYVKELAQEPYFALRFEMKYSKEAAQVAWESFVDHDTSPGEFLREEFNALPIIETGAWLALEKVLPKEGQAVAVEKHVPDSNKTLVWFRRQVDPAIRRMLNDHEHGYRIHGWLLDLIDYWENGNET